jgi:hypothetical protein
LDRRSGKERPQELNPQGGSAEGVNCQDVLTRELADYASLIRPTGLIESLPDWQPFTGFIALTVNISFLADARFQGGDHRDPAGEGVSECGAIANA